MILTRCTEQCIILHYNGYHVGFVSDTTTPLLKPYVFREHTNLCILLKTMALVYNRVTCVEAIELLQVFMQRMWFYQSLMLIVWIFGIMMS